MSLRTTQFRAFSVRMPRERDEFDVSSFTSGVDRDFDDTPSFERFVVTRLRDRGAI